MYVESTMKKKNEELEFIIQDEHFGDFYLYDLSGYDDLEAFGNMVAAPRSITPSC
jgi:hypothetical protein